MFLGRDGFIWWIGVIEDNQDPSVLGRAKVRIFGYHDNASTGEMPTADLPWAVVVMPANMPGAYGIPNLGDWVLGFFLDGEEAQEPCILGYIPGIPPGTIPADIKERFSEQISTVRSFNTVANVLPNSYSITGTKQKDRFRYEQTSGNTFEMVNDTSAGNPIDIVRGGGGEYLRLESGLSEIGINSFAQDRLFAIRSDYTVIRDFKVPIIAQGQTITPTVQNSYISTTSLPTVNVNIPGYTAAYSLPAREALVDTNITKEIGDNNVTFRIPSAYTQAGAYDTVTLVRDVRLLMNTVFPPNAVVTGATQIIRYRGGGGDCFLGESLVTMADGTQKRIDQVKDGDYVFNMSKTQVNKVLFIEKVIDKYNWQELYTPSPEYEPFATPNHPLFVNGEWVAMEQGLYPWLEDVKPVKNPITRKVEGELVYNLWITGDGTYIVNDFGTTSIMMHGGIMRVAYQYGYLTQDYIMELMKEFTTQSAEMTHGAYIFNNLFAHITHKPTVKVMANIIKRDRSFLPRKAMILLMKVFGKAATLYNKLKG